MTRKKCHGNVLEWNTPPEKKKKNHQLANSRNILNRGQVRFASAN